MKLYRVQIVRTLYVLGEDALDATLIAEKSEFNREESQTTVIPVATDEAITDWDEDCLVYHSGKEQITLAQARG